MAKTPHPRVVHDSGDTTRPEQARRDVDVALGHVRRYATTVEMQAADQAALAAY